MFQRFLELTLILLFSFTTLQAQQTQITGAIEDQQGNAVPFAQIAIYKIDKETPFTGVASDMNGKFSLSIESGQYDMLISYIGYEDYKIEDIQIEQSGKNFGTIAIKESTKMMEEVVVQSTEIKQPVTTNMEGMAIRPDQTISNVGGTLLDVLRNTPSVRVSDDGSVSLRGSGTNILLDGRNSAITVDLEQIPASAIKKIEIINNPNAKYDAQSSGGVINIQLKQGEDLGATGKAELTVGSRFRTNANLNLSHKTEKYALFGGYSFRRWPRVGSSRSQRTTFSENEFLSQNNTDERKDLEHTVNFGADYFFGKNKLSYEGVFNKEDEDDLERNRTTLENLDDGSLIRAYVRDNNEIEENYTLDNALIYERLFDDKEQSLRALVSYSVRDQIEQQNIDIYSGTTVVAGEPNGMERSFNDDLRNTAVFQLDYAQPLFNGKLETGLKSILREFDNDYTYEILNSQTDEFVNQEDVSNRFVYKDEVYAAYAIYSQTFGDLKVAVGTRAEQTFVDTRLYDTDETNEQSYLDFFPSVQTSYALNDQNSVKATYSRRIDRPSAWRLNPFPDISDSLNVRVGDPNLQPEYIDSFELGHIFNNDKLNLTTNLFYRRVDGQIDWIVEVRDGISYRGPRNLNVSKTYGLELINTTQIFDWWNVNVSYSLFKTEVDGTNIDGGFTNSGTSWYTKFTSGFNLPAMINFQITGNYEAPEIEAQGRDLARYSVDASVQRSFDKVKVSLSLRDVFNSRRFAGENFGSDFEQTFRRDRETQIFLATVGYTFD
ncbi:TonB-dependent receptor [Fulvivirga sp. RKSG066]|nr:TonB-dependent receptor [Fulvivirga aurantia]